MERYFIIEKDSEIYKDYFEWLESEKIMAKIFNEFAKKHGIEARVFLPRKTNLHIVATQNDSEKFGEKFTKANDETGLKRFRANSNINKDWIKAVQNVEILSRPNFWGYGLHVNGKFWQRLFCNGENLYGSLETKDWDFELLDYMKEIKASEFYAVLEE